MDIKEIEQKVKDAVRYQLGIAVEAIKNTDHVVCDLGADSLDVVELIMTIEDVFYIAISDEEAEQCSTVQSIIDALDKRINK